MKRDYVLIWTMVILTCVTTPTSAVVVKSEFNAGDGGDGRDGWVSGSIDSPVVWDSDNGGCLKLTDTPVADDAVFFAPSKFLGDWSGSEYLSFDYKRGDHTEIEYDPVQLIYIFSGNDQWAFSASLYADNNWHNYNAYFNESSWAHTGGTKSWTDSLSNITKFYITGDLVIGSEINYLDNVMLVPEPATLLLLGLGGLALRRKHRA